MLVPLLHPANNGYLHTSCGGGHHPMDRGFAKNPFRKNHARILRKIAADDTENLGDLSTLAAPNVVAKLIENHKSSSTNIA